MEGGAKLLQSFIDERMWDEVRIIKNGQIIINNGLNAPILKHAEEVLVQNFESDSIEVYKLKEPD